jgi:hypothetical protein
MLEALKKQMLALSGTKAWIAAKKAAQENYL